MIASQIERAAVAAVQSPTVPLSALIDALAALERVAELPANPLIAEDLFIQVLHARNGLDAYLAPILAAVQVGVTA